MTDNANRNPFEGWQEMIKQQFEALKEIRTNLKTLTDKTSEIQVGMVEHFGDIHLELAKKVDKAYCEEAQESLGHLCRAGSSSHKSGKILSLIKDNLLIAAISFSVGSGSILALAGHFVLKWIGA